ncbi:carboxymuconolactone decarboxylase family protein [Rhizobium daejeonense]|uniref:Carboxymuconolactone decarboxylase family protein n=1 Tax=Rhizobium daejeonense TaxID=240521 RepID=A0A6M1SIL0_9HYPH|nr:carboxymuconolactone decarboxylase family protein [Rhizobium daejeonense]NGO66646.1 carboxymuconolactone decarboxylase family protein [Rhizobium daejeonense]
MSRIRIPTSVEAAPAASQPLLEAVRQQLGATPNLFLLMATSPVSLEGHLGLFSALAKGKLSVQTRNRIALAVAEVNGCDYCLSAHTYLGQSLAKLSDAEMEANRDGRSQDPKANAAVHFAAMVARERGNVSGKDVEAVRAAGYDDGEIVEIILHVALNSWTNYLNKVADTEIDFPLVKARQAA